MEREKVEYLWNHSSNYQYSYVPKMELLGSAACSQSIFMVFSSTHLSTLYHAIDGVRSVETV